MFLRIYNLYCCIYKNNGRDKVVTVETKRLFYISYNRCNACLGFFFSFSLEITQNFAKRLLKSLKTEILKFV